MVYLDYAANAPVDQDVLDAFTEATITYFANPNATHPAGIAAYEAIEAASKHITSYFGASSDEIIYTSGATESNNLAIKGIAQRYKNRGRHILIGPLEHNSLVSSAMSMQEQGYEIELLSLNHYGQIDLEDLKRKVRDDTILVSVCAADSELGIVQPIADIAAFLKDKRCFFHTDASQAIGKVKINYRDVDLITFTPHKFYGLNGSGALIKRKKIGLKAQIDGGKSTTIYRSGTPVTAQIIAMDVALRKAIDFQEERYAYAAECQKALCDFLSQYPHITLNHTAFSHPYIVNFSIDQITADAFSSALMSHDIYISTKTSCCPPHTPSKLVFALTHDRSRALSSLRISLSHLTTSEDLHLFYEAFNESYRSFFHE